MTGDVVLRCGIAAIGAGKESGAVSAGKEIGAVSAEISVFMSAGEKSSAAGADRIESEGRRPVPRMRPWRKSAWRRYDIFVTVLAENTASRFKQSPSWRDGCVEISARCFRPRGRLFDSVGGATRSLGVFQSITEAP